MSPPRSRRDSRQEAEPRRPKSRQEFSPSSRWDSWREAKSWRPKSRRDPGGNPAKIPPEFTAGSENSAAKISAGDPASALGAKRNPGGQNLGGIPVVILPRSRRDSRRGTEIPAAKISAGPGGNPGGIPPRSCQDPGGFFTRAEPVNFSLGLNRMSCQSSWQVQLHSLFMPTPVMCQIRHAK